MSPAIIEQLAQTAKRIKHAMVDERSQAYDFAPGFEEYADTLRRLPFTSPLFVTFRRYAEARAAYVAEIEQQQRWRGQLEQLRQYIEAVVDSRDTNTKDYQALLVAERRAKDVARLLTDPHEVLRELKDLMDRANDNWGRAWDAYQRTLEEERQIAAADARSTVTGYSPTAGALEQVRARLAQFEAAQG